MYLYILDTAGCKLESPTDIMYVYDQQYLPTEVSRHIQKGIAEFIVTTFHKFPYVQSGVLTQVAQSVSNLPLGRYSDMDQVTSALVHQQDDNLPLMLVEVRTKGFRDSNGGRVDSRKVAVVFIHDGIDNLKDLDIEARRLKFKDRVEVFVVYIGKTAPHHVRHIASEPSTDHVIHVTSYTDTELWTQAVLSTMCQF